MTRPIGHQLNPLRKEIQLFTRGVPMFAVVTGPLFFAFALQAAGTNWSEGFIFGIGMLMAFVPEGLLPTLALAMGVQRMVARRAQVKRLSSVATLGCTTLRRLLVTLLLRNNARLALPDGSTLRWTILGDPAEAALHVVAAEAGLDERPETQRMLRLRQIPFESSRKRMRTRRRQDGATMALVKDALRKRLAVSTRIRRQGDALRKRLALSTRIRRQGATLRSTRQAVAPSAPPQAAAGHPGTHG